MFNRRLYRMRPWQISGGQAVQIRSARSFLRNNLSAQRSAQMFENANLAGAAHVDVDDLAVNRQHGNQARDLLRKTFRNTNWPPVHSFKAVSYNRGKQKNETQKLSMLLSHELVHSLLKLNEPEEFMSRQQALCETGPICSCIWRKCIISASTQLRHCSLAFGWMLFLSIRTEVSRWRRWSSMSSATQPCGFPLRLFQRSSQQRSKPTTASSTYSVGLLAA